MQKLIKEYFVFPETGRMTEKVFYGRMTLYVAVILLSLISLAFSSYSLYSKQVGYVSSDMKYIDADVKIFDNTENGELIESPLGGFVIRPESGYTVTLSVPDESEADTLFCEVSIIANKGNITRYSAQFSKGEDVVFDIRTSSVATVEFVTVYGSYIYHDSADLIKDGDIIEF